MLHAFDCVKVVEQPVIMFGAGIDHKLGMNKEVVGYVRCCVCALGCDMEKDVVTCPINYGGILLFNNITPHQRFVKCIRCIVTVINFCQNLFASL